jgi:hypothetical protein
MPKTSGIPKSILADINKLKNRLTSLEKNHSSLLKDFKSTIRSHSEMLKKQQSTIAQQGSTIAQQESTIAQLGKKSVKKEKRKPSEYNLFLKGKMSQGMSMVDAVKAWKERDSSTSSTSSSMRQTGQDWQSPTQQY